MFITKSNKILNTEPSVFIGDNGNFNPASVTDPDFATLYRSTDNNRLTFDFGSVSNINYVAFAGTNIAGNNDFGSRFTVRDGSTVIARTFVKYNNCCVVSFETRNFSNLRVGMYNAKGEVQPIVRFIAAGEGFIVPNNGESAGYNRQFLNRATKSRASLNSIAGPTSYLKTKLDLKGALSLPNMTKDFTENEWQDFLNFAVDNYFFIREQDPEIEVINGEDTTKNNSAYLCYEPTNTRVVAHAQTRDLNNASVSFKVFNGL